MDRKRLVIGFLIVGLFAGLGLLPSILDADHPAGEAEWHQGCGGECSPGLAGRETSQMSPRTRGVRP